MFSKLFGRVTAAVEHDVEQIIADFTTTVAKLEAAAAAKLKEADVHTAASVAASNLSTDAFAAADKATKVASQLKALVS